MIQIYISEETVQAIKGEYKNNNCPVPSNIEIGEFVDYAINKYI